MLLRPSQKPVGLWPGVSGSSAARSPAQQAWWCEQAPVGLGLQLCPRTSSEIKKKSGDGSSSTGLDAGFSPITDLESSILPLLWIGPVWGPSAEHHRFAVVADCVYSSAPAGLFSLKAHAKPNREEQRAMQKPGYLPTPVTKPVVAYSSILWPI